MKSVYKSFIVFLWSFFMVACSGGGGEIAELLDPDPTSDEIIVSLSISNTQIAVAKPAVVMITVKDASGAVVNTLVAFTLNNETYGIFDPITGEVATVNGVASIEVNTAEINTGVTITATITSGETASINITMVGDGG